MSKRHVIVIVSLLLGTVGCMAPVVPGAGSDRSDKASEESATFNVSFHGVGAVEVIPWPALAGAVAMKRLVTVDGPEGYVLAPIGLTQVVDDKLVPAVETLDALPEGVFSTGTEALSLAYHCEGADPEDKLVLLPRGFFNGTESEENAAAEGVEVGLTVTYTIAVCDPARLTDEQLEAPSDLCAPVWEAAPEMAVVGSCELPVKAAPEALDLDLIAAGKAQFGRSCSGCHALDRRKAGPALRDIVGARVGDGSYSYSPALRTAWENNVVWTPENLDGWLEDARAFAQENFGGSPRMFFRMRDAEDRAAIIAYLKNPDALE